MLIYAFQKGRKATRTSELEMCQRVPMVPKCGCHAAVLFHGSGLGVLFSHVNLRGHGWVWGSYPVRGLCLSYRKQGQTCRVRADEPERTTCCWIPARLTVTRMGCHPITVRTSGAKDTRTTGKRCLLGMNASLDCPKSNLNPFWQWLWVLTADTTRTKGDLTSILRKDYCWNPKGNQVIMAHDSRMLMTFLLCRPSWLSLPSQAHFSCLVELSGDACVGSAHELGLWVCTESLLPIPFGWL